MEKTDDVKIIVLAEELGEDPNDIKVSRYDESVFVVGIRQYLVLHDYEVETRMEEQLEKILDEVILPKIVKPYDQYIDRKKWMSDARMDGAASIFGLCDGEEISRKYKDEWYFIYRIR